MNDLLLPKYVETAAALDYNLETGAWAGATLDESVIDAGTVKAAGD